ncbi:MAG: hypothetical protein RLZZ204_892 [Bacteroidota bacterium]|jgi:UPF0271 protein
MKQWVDLNCDLGEGCTTDEAIMPYISSANIACGYHAGDVETIKQTLALAEQYNVAIGAHPSYPDSANFGRKEMDLPIQEIKSLVSEQIRIVQSLAAAMGLSLHHVKPHGALYNKAAKDEETAAAIAEAVYTIDPSLILFGLANSESGKAAKKIGLQFYNEVFADRTYTDQGQLTPRTEANAMITTDEEAIRQVMQMLQEETVTSTNGKRIPIQADTICIHGDGEHAVSFAKQINTLIKHSNIKISSKA